MAATLPDPPLRTPLYDDAKEGLITRVWNNYFLALTTRIQQSASVLKAVALTGQSASISTTAIPMGTIAAGLYRVQWEARITTPGTVSSSLTITISYTDDGVSCSQSGAAITGNTTSTVQSGVILVESDQTVPISYATTYASAGAQAMIYKLNVTCELVN